MKVTGDLSRLFTAILTFSWLFLVALPIAVSVLIGRPGKGLPLLGVIVWFIVLRVGRFLSPAGRADALMRRGRAASVLALADRALAVKGSAAWLGERRLGWLHR